MKSNTNTKLGRVLLLLFPVILIFSIHQKAYSQVTDFSGNWKRNNDKSQVQDEVSFNMIPTGVYITQDSQSISIKRNSGESVYTEVIKLNGSTSETITPSKLKRTATIQWSTDRKEFTETFTSKDDQGIVQQSGKQIFSLLDDGKTLKITANQNYKDHGITIHMEEVFDKQ